MSQVLTPPKGKPKIGKLIASTPTVVKALIFGESGAGKTTLLTTAPKPLLILNVDNSISVLPPDEGIMVYPDPAEKRPISSWEEFVEIVDWLIAEGAKEFATIAVDTATEAGELLKEYILSSPGPTSRAHPKVLSRADYGLYAELFLEQLRRLRDLPCNVVINAQIQDVMIDEPDGGTALYKLPAFGGQKTTITAPAMFDIVGYLGVAEDKDHTLIRKMLLQPIGNRKAKIRTKPGVEAPVVVDNPNLTELFSLVVGA